MPSSRSAGPVPGSPAARRSARRASCAIRSIDSDFRAGSRTRSTFATLCALWPIKLVAGDDQQQRRGPALRGIRRGSARRRASCTRSTSASAASSGAIPACACGPAAARARGRGGTCPRRCAAGAAGVSSMRKSPMSENCRRQVGEVAHLLLRRREPIGRAHQPLERDCGRDREDDVLPRRARARTARWVMNCAHIRRGRRSSRAPSGALHLSGRRARAGFLRTAARGRGARGGRCIAAGDRSRSESTIAPSSTLELGSVDEDGNEALPRVACSFSVLVNTQALMRSWSNSSSPIPVHLAGHPVVILVMPA